MTIQIKRIYEDPRKSDGFRILVDRIWPRGIKKDEAQIDLWLKDIAPSTKLRKWFNHDPEKWKEFLSRYHTELKGSEAFKNLKSLIKKHGVTTLLYSAKDEEHNQALALKGMINR